MSYHLNKGDLFFSYEKDIWLDNVGICNPVNTVGVMGAGLAFGLVIVLPIMIGCLGEWIPVPGNLDAWIGYWGSLIGSALGIIGSI